MNWTNTNDLIFCSCCILFMIYGTKCVNGYYNYSHIFNHLSFDEKQTYFKNTFLVKYLCLSFDCVPYFKTIVLDLIMRINNILFVLNQVLIHLTNILSTDSYTEIRNKYRQELRLLDDSSTNVPSNGTNVVNNYNGVLEQIPLIIQENDEDEKNENLIQNVVCLEDIDLSMCVQMPTHAVLETEQMLNQNILLSSNEFSETIETFPMVIMENIHKEITSEKMDLSEQVNLSVPVQIQAQTQTQTHDVYENLSDYLNSHNVGESTNLNKICDLDEPNDLIEIDDIDFSKTLEEQVFVKNNIVVQVPYFVPDVKQNNYDPKSPLVTQTIKIGKKKRVVN